MSWHDGYDARDTSLADSVFDTAFGNIRDSRLVASPVQYIDGYGTWNKGIFALCITRNELILAKKGLFSSQLVVQIPLEDFLRGRFGNRSDLARYEVYSELKVGGSATFLFQTHDAAESVYEYLNSGIAMLDI